MSPQFGSEKTNWRPVSPNEDPRLPAEVHRSPPRAAPPARSAAGAAQLYVKMGAMAPGCGITPIFVRVMETPGPGGMGLGYHEAKLGHGKFVFILIEPNIRSGRKLQKRKRRQRLGPILPAGNGALQSLSQKSTSNGAYMDSAWTLRTPFYQWHPRAPSQHGRNSQLHMPLD